MTLDGLFGAGELVLKIAGAVGAIYVAVKKIYRMARNIEELIEKVNNLSAETKPNSGATLRDAIDRMELKLETLDARVERLEATRVTRGVL